MYFALPCDALLVSPPANLAAGNTNIRNKDKQNLSSKQIPAESETRHVQGVLLLAQLCSHLSRKDNRTTSNTRASQPAAWACLLVTVLSLYRLISCHDGISGFTNLQMCTVSAFDPDFSCKLVLQKIQAYTDPYLPTHRFKMRYANRNFKTPKAPKQIVLQLALEAVQKAMSAGAKFVTSPGADQGVLLLIWCQQSC